ncbi:MAG: 2OG-Fe(II) oxygenase [Rhodospirillaceae bacterium]
MLIDRFEADDRKHPSTVGNSDRRQDPGRTGTILFLNDRMDDWKDAVVQTHAAVAKAVADYAAAFPALTEHLSSGRVGCRYPRIERVDPGQGFTWHADNAGMDTAERVLACLLYLSDVKNEGATEFMHQGQKIQPETGKVVVFPPYWTHLHRGVSPAQEVKYTMSFFWSYLDGKAETPQKLTWSQRLRGKL